MKPISIRVPAGTATQEPLEERKASVYPNPFTDAFTLELDQMQASNYEINLMDSKGRHVTSLTDGKLGSGETIKFSDEVAGLESGSYIIEIIAPDKSIKVVKLVKVD